VAGVPEEALIALFVAQHQHSPSDCPALSGRGEQLLSRVSAAAAARYGVTIEVEAFIADQHVLLLVVDAASLEAVSQFLMLLPGCGDLTVLPAFTAEEAVERGGCLDLFLILSGSAVLLCRWFCTFLLAQARCTYPGDRQTPRAHVSDHDGR